MLNLLKLAKEYDEVTQRGFVFTVMVNDLDDELPAVICQLLVDAYLANGGKL